MTNGSLSYKLMRLPCPLLMRKKTPFPCKNDLAVWHGTDYLRPMSRPILLTIVAVSALSSISSTAFSAALVDSGVLIGRLSLTKLGAKSGSAVNLATLNSRAIWDKAAAGKNGAAGSIAGRNEFLSGIAARGIPGAHLLAGTATSFSVKPFALDNLRAGSDLTLTGVSATAPASQITLPEALALDAAAMDSIATVDSAPAAAPSAMGSASAFAVVPEPSSVALLAFGALALVKRRRS